MTDRQELDAIVSRYTAFADFGALLSAVRTGYVPTIDVVLAPALLPVALALVDAGKDARLLCKDSETVRASSVGFMAPEVLAELGITFPQPEVPTPGAESEVNQFMQLVVHRSKQTGERHGQAAFALLEQVRPELAERVRGTDDDPYYKTGFTTLYCFRLWLMKHWTPG